MKTVKTQKTENPEHAGIVPVVLIRHAESEWNRENRFTGWANPDLTEAGVREAARAGLWLQANGYRFDAAYSSRLTRAIVTLGILLEQTGQTGISRQTDWRLNERHYGALQGTNKSDATTKVGEYQVWRWRRGYHDSAVPLSRTDLDHPANDPSYADIAPRLLPDVENLAQTRTRVIAFWEGRVVPHIRQDEQVLISAHGNTLRALLMDLSGMGVKEVEGFEIPTARPIQYDFDRDGRALDWRYLDTHSEPAMSA
jgi:2,3-bisphosphoglycerate-dependent phosphoglycerate mutase